jgi:hypothetical protein
MDVSQRNFSSKSEIKNCFENSRLSFRAGSKNVGWVEETRNTQIFYFGLI